MATGSVLLCPRPYARYSGRLLLLPLLPPKPSLRSLPTEVWSNIFANVVKDTDRSLVNVIGEYGKSSGLSLLLVCKHFTVRWLSHISVNTSRLHELFIGSRVTFIIRQHPPENAVIIPKVHYTFACLRSEVGFYSQNSILYPRAMGAGS
jgi:hypothetical protein